jgi:hypothetical protein
VDVRIVGVNLPGRAWGGYDNIHVGVQRQAEVVDLVAGDAREAVWSFVVDVTAEGDFRGPFVHGKKGDRFFYLSWGTVGAAGGFSMFRRAKLMLAAVDAGTLAAAVPAHRLVATLALTDGKGGPRCASVRPPAIAWTVAPA